MIAAGACACAGSWSGGLSSSVIAQGDCQLYGVTQDVLQGWLWGLFGSETGFGVVLPSGAPDVFPDVELRSMAEFLLCHLLALSHLSPSAFLALPLPRCSMWTPALRECSSNASPAHPPPRNPSRLALSGPRTLWDTGGGGWPRTPVPGHSPCTRPPSLGTTDDLPAVGCTAPLRSPSVHLLPKPSISQRHKFSRGLLQNEPPMEARPVVAMPLP